VSTLNRIRLAYAGLAIVAALILAVPGKALFHSQQNTPNLRSDVAAFTKPRHMRVVIERVVEPGYAQVIAQYQEDVLLLHFWLRGNHWRYESWNCLNCSSGQPRLR